METNLQSDDKTLLIKTKSNDSHASEGMQFSQHSDSQSLMGHLNDQNQAQTEKKGRFQLKRQPTNVLKGEENSQQEISPNTIGTSSSHEKADFRIKLMNESKSPLSRSQCSAHSSQAKVDSQPRLNLGKGSSTSQNISVNNSQGNMTSQHVSRQAHNSADQSQLAVNNASHLNLLQTQTIIQMEAEIPGHLNGGMATLQSHFDGLGDLRAMELLTQNMAMFNSDNVEGNFQLRDSDIVQHKGRFRIHETNLNGIHNLSGAANHNETLHQSSDKQLTDKDRQKQNNQLQVEQHSPMFNSDDNEMQKMQKLKRQELASRFEITQLKRVEQDKLGSTQNMSKEAIDKHQLNGSVSNIESPKASNMIQQKELFLMNSKSKSQTGFIKKSSNGGNTRRADGVNDSQLRNLNHELDSMEKISNQNQKKRGKLNRSGYRTNRLGSDASLADLEDNLPSKLLQSSIKNEDRHDELERRSSDDKANGNDDVQEVQNDDDQNEDDHADDEQDDNDQDDEQDDEEEDKEIEETHDDNVLQEEAQTHDINDQDNEADESNAGIGEENRDNDDNDQNADNEGQDQDNLNDDENTYYASQNQVVAQNNREDRHLDGYKYSSELRSDKSQQDIESPNDYTQSVNNFKMIVNNQDNHEKPSKSKKDRQLLHPQGITSNEQLNSDFAYTQEQYNHGLNNSVNHETKRFDWNHVQTEESFQNVNNIHHQHMNTVTININDSMDFQNKEATQQIPNNLDNSSQPQVNQPQFQHNSMFENKISSSNQFRKELVQHLGKFGTAQNLRLDSENIDPHQVNAALGLNDQEDVQTSMNMQQIQLIKRQTIEDETHNDMEQEQKETIEEDNQEEEKVSSQKAKKSKKKLLQNDNMEMLLETLADFIDKRSKKGKSKNANDPQRGESLTSIKKDSQGKSTAEDVEQKKGRFTIKNSTEDKNNENKSKKGKGKISFNQQQSESQKFKSARCNLQDQMSPNPQSQLAYLQHMQMLRDQSKCRPLNNLLGFNQIDQSLMMHQPLLSQQSQHLMMMGSYHPGQQSVMSFNPLYQQPSHSPLPNKKSSLFDVHQMNLTNQYFSQQQVHRFDQDKSDGTDTNGEESSRRSDTEGQNSRTKKSTRTVTKEETKADENESFRDQVKRNKKEQKDKQRKKEAKDLKKHQKEHRRTNYPDMQSQMPHNSFINHYPQQFMPSYPNMLSSYQYPYNVNEHQINPYSMPQHFPNNSSTCCNHQQQLQMQSQIVDQFCRHQQVMFNQMLNCHQQILNTMIYQQARNHNSSSSSSSSSSNDSDSSNRSHTSVCSPGSYSYRDQTLNYPRVRKSPNHESSNQHVDSSDNDDVSPSNNENYDEQSMHTNEQNQGHSFAEQNMRSSAERRQRRNTQLRESELIKQIASLRNQLEKTKGTYRKEKRQK